MAAVEPWNDNGVAETADAQSGIDVGEMDSMTGSVVSKVWRPRNKAEKEKMSSLERRGVETIATRLLSPDDVALPRVPRPLHAPRAHGVLVDEDAERSRVLRLERLRAQLALPVSARPRLPCAAAVAHAARVGSTTPLCTPHGSAALTRAREPRRDSPPLQRRRRRLSNRVAFRERVRDDDRPHNG